MWLYLLIFAVALACTAQPKLNRSRVYLAGALAFLAIFVGLGDMLGGYDRYIYGALFDSTYDFRLDGRSVVEMPIWGYGSEFGYVYLNYFLSYVTANRYIYILIVTCLVYFNIYHSFKEYIDNFPLAIVLFLALQFFFTFTYLREVIGMSFAWFAYRQIIKRNLFLFVCFVFIAFTFHNSAIVVLPMWFIPNHKFNKHFIWMVFAVVVAIGLTSLPSSLYEVYSAVADDEGRAASYAGDFDAGTFRWEYLLEATFFLAVIHANYERIPKTTKNVVLCNVAIVCCYILAFFVRSSNGGRLGWYYMIGVIATLTTILVQPGVRRYTKHMMYMVCFVLFFRIVFYWNVLLFPYKTFLSEGHRDNDPVFNEYEYDMEYDVDKFYRPAFVLFQKE